MRSPPWDLFLNSVLNNINPDIITAYLEKFYNKAVVALLKNILKWMDSGVTYKADFS